MGKWYDQGRKDALEGQIEDPPMFPGNPKYEDYREGYEDGQSEIDAEADFDRAGARKHYQRPRRV